MSVDPKKNSKINENTDINPEQSNNENLDINNSGLEIKFNEEDSSLSEIEEWKNKSFRLAADLQNSQKQQEIDIANNTKNTKKRAISSLNQFLNTLFLAFSFIPKDINETGLKYIETLKKSFNSLVEDLKNLNIIVIIPQENQLFDPKLMSALNESEGGDGEVVVDKVVTLGYIIDSQVTTPSTVIIKKIDK